jgi:DNA-binding NtrC family response regulator
LLVGHFVRRFAQDVPRPIERVTPELLDVLAQHDWPGNVRELENVVHRAMLSSESEVLDVGSLAPSLRGRRAAKMAPTAPLAPPAPEPATLSLVALERDAIVRALAREGGNVTRAAKTLGLGRATLYRRLAALRIDVGQTAGSSRIETAVSPRDASKA